MKSTYAILPYFKNEKLADTTGFQQRQTIKNWLRVIHIKLFNWEYWPMWLVYLPSSFFFIYLSIKAKTFCFFSAANPSIETGGMIFESKWDIFKLIPSQYYPATILIKEAENINSIILKMSAGGITFPAVAKPDRGERGWCVSILQNKDDLVNYLSKYPIDFLIQQYVDYPIELSIFYYRHPDASNGTITSVTCKEYLKVTGDGTSTLHDLIMANDRAFLQLKKLQQSLAIPFNKILGLGETQLLVPFGNHVRGAMFLDYCSIIDDQLSATINNISRQIDGFYFGRFDIKCNSIDDLKKGKHVTILELNGSGAAVAHIYQPGYSFIKAQFEITRHYKMMYLAAKANHKKGVPYMSLKSFKQVHAAEKKHKQKIVDA